MNVELITSAVSARFPDLAGKVATVTGTSRGIGCGIAEFLARQGMKLVLTARSAEQGEAFAKYLETSGADCVWVAADLSTAEGAQAVFDAAVRRFERINLLVNNAAKPWSVPFLELDEQTYRHDCEGNIRLVYYLSRLVARHMIDAGGGSIVHLSSVGGLRAHQGMPGYDASKGAVDALTRAMAVDLAGHGIRVNSVAPGATETRRASSPKGDRHAGREQYIPLGRKGTIEEMGAAVAFLASDAAAYITGQILYVDGGLTAQLTPPGIHV